ncbi:nuclease-related domain-containing protein [Pseudalkalibacillus sp. Hm43]|uniref:nuclease-related domain-containing protein n=1 Tax=Pseudalkalibacillus sp. Hm43 TaxID=3450742 RepID=UPI003F4234BE
MKPRYESKELRIMRSLNVRMKLSQDDKNYKDNLEKGYIGEKRFDNLAEPFLVGKIVLNDMLLEHNNTVCQMDSLILSSPKINLIEIKNFEGDYYIEREHWYSTSGNVIKNPLHQLHRNEIVLRGLLKRFGYNVPIEPYLVFVNPEFHLYDSSRNLPIIHPPQLNRFLNYLKKAPPHSKGQHPQLPQQLLAHHLTENPYSKLPKYQYDQLKKGIYCPQCLTLYSRLERTSLNCKKCGRTEEYQQAVLRAVEEYQMLFPDKKITTSGIHEWCRIIHDKASIRKILMSNYLLVGCGRNSYYLRSD